MSNADLLSLITKQSELIQSLVDEVKELRNEINDLKTKKKISPKTPVEKVRCSGKTMKGAQCKNSCLDGKTVCAKHEKCNHTDDEPSTSSKPVKKPKIKKKAEKKELPLHNHGVNEPPKDGYCQLCDTHGDIFDPETPDADFEDIPVNGQSLEDRLRAMLESEGE